MLAGDHVEQVLDEYYPDRSGYLSVSHHPAHTE